VIATTTAEVNPIAKPIYGKLPKLFGGGLAVGSLVGEAEGVEVIVGDGEGVV